MCSIEMDDINEGENDSTNHKQFYIIVKYHLTTNSVRMTKLAFPVRVTSVGGDYT